MIQRVLMALAALLAVGLAPGTGLADAPADGRAELRLYMFDRPGCAWCERWDAEIGPVYPMTAEGRCAPLVRSSIFDPMPAGVAFESEPRYTPTFVLVENGREVGRIQGYPGEDFFWPLLGRLLGAATTRCDPQDGATG